MLASQVPHHMQSAPTVAGPHQTLYAPQPRRPVVLALNHVSEHTSSSSATRARRGSQDPVSTVFDASAGSAKHARNWRPIPTRLVFQSPKQRRPSLVAGPYDSAQSPTRARFDHDTKGYFAHYPPAQHMQAPMAPMSDPWAPYPGVPMKTQSEHPHPNRFVPLKDALAPADQPKPKSKALPLERSEIAPTNLVLVPQTHAKFGRDHPDSKPRRAVTFEWEGFSDGGVKVGNVFSPPVSKKQLVLKGGDDQVLKALTGKSLNVHITWPGYTTVTKRVSIVADGKPISREALLLNLCRALKDGMEGLKRAGQSEPGYLEYTLDARKSVTFRDVFISELVHCGGSDWRLQCWIPKPSSSDSHARQQAYPSPSL